MTCALDPRPHAPVLPAATIERARLHEALDAHRSRPLTLVSAPAGWGKTVLLAAWAAARGAAWLTIGSRHSDATRLQSDADAALRAAAGDAPALVLDDVHLVLPDAMAALGELVAGGTSVVAAARFDPDLRLDRMRLAGRLGELRAAELAFTEAEGAELFAAMGLELRADQVARLVARTEGWAAGLRLAGLTLGGEADPDAFVAGFAGEDRAVADYLACEVLDGRPPDTREFLLRTSVADRLCGELADALTGAPDGALTLERLARAGMFVTPLDSRRRWYRYHGLFREHLRARLRLEQPGAERELHARAAAWLAANGRGAEAVAHALAAGDAGGCDELLAEQWVELLAGGRDAVVVAPASDRRRTDARLAVAAAAGCLERGDATAAEARLDAAGSIDRGYVDAAGDVGSIAALLRARARGDVAAARDAAAQLRGPRRPDALRAVAQLEVGVTEFEHGLPEAAAERLEAAAALAAEAGAEWVALAAGGRSAALEAAAGRLARAQKAGRAAIATAERRGWHRGAPAAWAYAALAAVHWQRDELDDAERRCDAAAAAAHASADGRALVAIRALRAHLAAAHGDVERGRGLLSAVEHELPDAGVLLRRWIEALGPAAWAPPSDGGPVAETEASAPPGNGRPKAAPSAPPGGPVAEAAAWLRRGDPLAALRRAEPLAECDPPAHPATCLHALVVTAAARHSLGRAEEASRALERALAIASAEGYRRPFLTGLPLRRLLERELERPTPYGPLVVELLDALQQRDDPPAGLPEPLSERERAVLRLLPTLLSYPEIGGELFVAANTVKTHVKSIYRKLDVGSRRDAVARARALRLI